MSEVYQTLLTQVPFFGALCFLIIIVGKQVLNHIQSIQSESQKRMQDMHQEALGRHEASDDVIKDNTKAHAATMVVLDKMERKLDAHK